MRTVRRRPSLCGVLALALGSWVSGTPRPAAADVAYAFSSNSLGPFLVIANSDNSLLANFNGGVNTVNTAAFGGFGKDTQQGTLNAPQAESGPGGFPPEDTFGMKGMTGEYARSDSAVSLTQDGSLGLGRNVAEAYRTSPGSASARAGVVLRSQPFTLPTTGEAGMLIAFFATPVMVVHATGNGRAQAGINFSVSVVDSGGRELLLWAPSGDPKNDFRLTAGSVSGVADPFSLNAFIEAPPDGQYRPGLQRYNLTYRPPPSSDSFYVEVAFSEDVSVVIVPEPSPLRLAAFAAAVLLGPAWLLRRRRAAPVRAA